MILATFLIRFIWHKTVIYYWDQNETEKMIMVSDFCFLFEHFSLFSLFKTVQSALEANLGLMKNENLNIFQHQKDNKEYWDVFKLLKWIVKIELLNSKMLFFKFFSLFMFDHTTSHPSYVDQDILHQQIKIEYWDKQLYWKKRQFDCINIYKSRMILYSNT